MHGIGHFPTMLPDSDINYYMHVYVNMYMLTCLLLLKTIMHDVCMSHVQLHVSMVTGIATGF